LVGRGTERADVIARRLETARVELAARSEFDAQPPEPVRDWLEQNGLQP
jgi:guanylate kinase